MSVVTAFSAPPVVPHVCKVCRILDDLDPELRAAALGMLADQDVFSNVLMSARLESIGKPVSSHTVRVHRLRCS